MKKIGLVTLYGNFNYGNRLQNYAVQKIFNKRGVECETIVVRKSICKEITKKVVQILKSLVGDNVSKRRNRFDQFNRKNINTKKIYRRNGLIAKEISALYDFFCVGSDQVWNPEIRKNERWNLFLQFAEARQRMCISPSIGVNRIPNQYREEFSEYFQGFSYLSCREQEGADDIALLSGKDCEHLIDPTLVLTKDEWLEFSTELVINKKYIVVFFLGNLKNENLEKINNYAQSKGYEIINLSDKLCLHYAVDPKEFISLIYNAQLVFTDSFHAAAFSINLNTPFYVLDRHQKEEVSNHMSSRIHSLVSLFELKDRYCQDDVGVITENCDFINVNNILAFQREKFDNYLDKCLRDFGENE